MSRWARSTTGKFAIVLGLVSVPAAVTIYSPAIAGADSCTAAATNIALPLNAPPCADVLAQETRWLKAITDVFVLQDGVWMALSGTGNRHLKALI